MDATPYDNIPFFTRRRKLYFRHELDGSPEDQGTPLHYQVTGPDEYQLELKDSYNEFTLDEDQSLCQELKFLENASLGIRHIYEDPKSTVPSPLNECLYDRSVLSIEKSYDQNGECQEISKSGEVNDGFYPLKVSYLESDVSSENTYGKLVQSPAYIMDSATGITEKLPRYSAEDVNAMWDWMAHHQECGIGGPVGLWKFALYKNLSFTYSQPSSPVRRRTAASMASKYNKVVAAAECSCPKNLLAWRAFVRASEPLTRLRRCMHDNMHRGVRQSEVQYYYIMDDVYWLHESLRLGEIIPYESDSEILEDDFDPKIEARRHLGLISALHLAILHPNYERLKGKILKTLGSSIIQWLRNSSTLKNIMSQFLVPGMLTNWLEMAHQQSQSEDPDVGIYELAIKLGIWAAKTGQGDLSM